MFYLSLRFIIVCKSTAVTLCSDKKHYISQSDEVFDALWRTDSLSLDHLYVKPVKYVIQLYIRVSVVLSKSLCRREMEKMISNLDSAVKFQQLLKLRV